MNGRAWWWLAVCLVPALTGTQAASADNKKEIFTATVKYSAEDGISKTAPPTFDLHISSFDFNRPTPLQLLRSESHPRFDLSMDALLPEPDSFESITDMPNPQTPPDEQENWAMVSLGLSVVTAYVFPPAEWVWTPTLLTSAIFGVDLLEGPITKWVDSANGGTSPSAASLDLVDKQGQLKPTDYHPTSSSASVVFLRLIVDRGLSVDGAGDYLPLVVGQVIELATDHVIEVESKGFHIKTKSPEFRVVKEVISNLAGQVVEAGMEAGMESGEGSGCPVLPSLPGQVVATPVICPDTLKTALLPLAAAPAAAPSVAITADTFSPPPAIAALPAIRALLPTLDEQPATVTVSKSQPGTLIYRFSPRVGPPSSNSGRPAANSNDAWQDNRHGQPIEVEIDGPDINSPLHIDRNQ